jgi:long-chain acyl-CoA synthetase
VDGVSIAHRVAVREAHAPNPFPRSSYDAAVTDLASVPVIDDAGTELLSRAAADHLGSRVVGTLSAQGHRPGARVAFCAPNSALLLAAVWGCLRAGYAPVVLSATLMPRERTEMVADIEPAVLFGADDLAVAVDGPPGALADRFSCRPIHFTSGTSGRPKGVWSGWLPPEHADALVADEHDAWDFTGTDRHLVCSPLSHSAPLRFALHTLHHGGSVLLPPGFDPAVAGRLLAERDVTTTFMAPAHLQRLLATERPRATALRLLAFAGSFCPPPVRAAAVQTFGPDVVREFYGSTEGQFTVCTPDEERRRPGTVGRARPGRALRVDDTGRIWCRPPAHARFEYWGDPAKTAESWDGEWFTVGDLGRVDDDGYLFLDGRRSDLVISGGVNVYPAEIERVLSELPGVRQAVAFGLPDERWGHKVCVAVVGSVTEPEVVAYCAAHLAPYKRPKEVHLTEQLPVTHSGKVDRRRIALAYGGGPAPGVTPPAGR